jgi:prephenate dehydratase
MKRIALLGPPGTFSEESARHFLGTNAFEYATYKLIGDVFMATLSGETDYSFIPIENTIEGSVTLHLDYLVHEVDLPIQAEWVYPIRMNLIGLPSAAPAGDGANPFAHIKKVLSHQVVPSQCSQFMKTYLSHAEFEQVSSTAEGARLVKELGDPAFASIGPAASAELYGLNILAESIQNHQDNVTRFILVGREPVSLPRQGRPKTTILVTLAENFPGALHQVLAAFAWRRINLSRIESRPTKKKLGNYYFYIEIEGSLESVLLPAAIEEIRATGCQVRILGSYPSYSFSHEHLEQNSEV